ncbi:MAG: tRNA dihydrouridine synthase DusB [Cytophagales bacterium]|jgi:nifR3 family TIM-barrel protein|nr:tRNA dihydrouridine synthase DusB [Cytophagales bacterium]
MNLKSLLFDNKKFPLFLAPMEGVTDPPFRFFCKKFGVDVTYTEFISSEGLIRNAEKSVKKLKISDSERPIGIQIFGHNVESMKLAATIAEEQNPDMIDINCGCPVKKVVAKGCGSALLKDIEKLQKMAAEVVRNVKIPVTVKTRLGWDRNSIVVEELVERLQDVGVQAVTIHARTRCQMYSGEADWSYIGKVKNNSRIKIPIIGNGDINSAEKTLAYKNKWGIDGIMIGRATIGHPWIFDEIKYSLENKKYERPNIEEIILQHMNMEKDYKNEHYAVVSLRKHYKNYFKHMPDVKNLKLQLMEAESIESVKEIFDNFKK